MHHGLRGDGRPCFMPNVLSSIDLLLLGHGVLLSLAEGNNQCSFIVLNYIVLLYVTAAGPGLLGRGSLLESESFV